MTKGEKILLFIFIVVSLLIAFLWPVLYPFIFGAVISFLLHPIVKKLETYKIKKNYAIALVMVIFLLSVILIFVFIIPPLLEQAKLFALNLNSYFQESRKIFENIAHNLVKLGIPVNKNQIIQTFSSQLNNLVTPFFTSFLSELMSNIQDIIFSLILIPLTVFYILKDKDKIFWVLEKYFAKQNVKIIEKIYQEIVLKLRLYVRSVFIVSIVVAFFMTILLSFFGVNYSLLLGIFSGLVSIIPYLGVILQMVTIAIVQISGGHSFITIVWLIAIQSLFYFFIGFFLQPKLTNRALKIHPLLFIIVIIIGGYSAGIIGMLFSIPVFIIFHTVISYTLRRIFIYEEEDNSHV